jgi:hypothetical protein
VKRRPVDDWLEQREAFERQLRESSFTSAQRRDRPPRQESEYVPPETRLEQFEREWELEAQRDEEILADLRSEVSLRHFRRNCRKLVLAILVATFLVGSIESAWDMLHGRPTRIERILNDTLDRWSTRAHGATTKRISVHPNVATNVTSAGGASHALDRLEGGGVQLSTEGNAPAADHTRPPLDAAPQSR